MAIFQSILNGLTMGKSYGNSSKAGGSEVCLSEGVTLSPLRLFRSCRIIDPMNHG